MGSQQEFSVGQTVIVDPGTKKAEAGEIVGFGSLLLKNKLKHTHLKTAIVHGLPTGTTTPNPTQTMTPAAKFAGDEQRVAGAPNLLLIVGLFVSAAIIALVFRSHAARKTRQSREIMVPLGQDSEDGPVE